MEKTALTHLKGEVRGKGPSDSALSDKKFNGPVLFILVQLCFFPLHGFIWVKRLLPGRVYVPCHHQSVAVCRICHGQTHHE